MKKLFIEDSQKHLGQSITLMGWVHKIKDFKDFSFLYLRDKSAIIQVVCEDKSLLKDLKQESAVTVTGMIKESPKTRLGFEMQLEDISILSQGSYDLLPFSISGKKVSASLDTQLDYPVLRYRVAETRAVFKVQHEIVRAFRGYLERQAFSEIHTPKIIGTETEGGSEDFTVDYFGKRTFLAQSPQFYKQMMVGAGFERVFEIGHAYRAELSSTWRHLTEYVSIDVEVGFIEDEFELMTLEEDLLKRVIDHIRTTCEDELKLLKVDLQPLKTIPRIELEQGREILLDEYDKASPKGGLDAEGEKLFAEYIKKEYGSDFVFLTKYPMSKRPFYTKTDPDKKGMTKSFDLIYKGLEITTGGQRIHDYQELVTSIESFGSDPESFGFYLESFKYGMPPHGGFAIGLERLTMMLLDIDTIKAASLLPRDIGRVTP